MKRPLKTLILGATALGGIGAPLVAIPQAADLNLFGRPGLVEMPSAEVLDDGDLAFSLSAFPGQTRSTLTFQVSPRLSGSFRYSGIADFFAEDDALYDRSFDISYLILTEGKYRPAVAVGLRDFIGTGFYSSEYIVATKSLTPDIRVTGGLGWGRLGSRGAIGAPFGERPPLDFGKGGRLTDSQWFKGDAAPFGGIEWNVNDQLTLSAEYSSDAYDSEEARDLFKAKSPVNVGLTYRFKNGNALSGYYLYGSEIGVGYTYVLNPRRSPTTTGSEPAPGPIAPRPARAADPDAWETDWVSDSADIARGQAAIGQALANDGIILQGFDVSATRARVMVKNTKFASHPQAIGRTARTLSRAMPASVEVFDITLETPNGLPSTTVTVRRSDLERLEFESSDALLSRVAFSDTTTANQPTLLPHERGFNWSFGPRLGFSLFDPGEPIAANLSFVLSGGAEVAPGLFASGAIAYSLRSASDKVLSPSGLPRVRTDSSFYDGNPYIANATLAWYARPMTNVYSRVTAGYMERAFGGVSTEVLWMPVDSKLALGAEVNYAKKRDYDGGLGFQDYDVVTGHATAYYDFGGGYLGQLSVGRYLAGDVGATVEFAREFNNGWSVGAYATRTDASFEDFGEGSFDKGIRLRIPFEWAAGRPSRGGANFNIRSLNRDGGSRLSVPGRLYDGVRETRQPELSDRWGRVWR